MLPFLVKPRGNTGITMEMRKPDSEQPQEDPGLKACAKDLMSAISSNDIAAFARALRAAFEILDSEPHVEGPHIGEDE